ncbi:MAG: hypothetical protein P1U57_11680 [Oleibacter sp.]|nr:hypothetical protein [Thalassolituus sp.]
MKIRYLEEDLELYDSETFLAFGLGETQVEIGDENQGEVLIFTFNFISDDTQERSITWDQKSNTEVKANLINWNDVIGTTLIKPLRGGSLFNREMVLTFASRKIGSEGETREISLSVYIGKELPNG